jgi:hypothetical protein
MQEYGDRSEKRIYDKLLDISVKSFSITTLESIIMQEKFALLHDDTLYCDQ